MEHCTSLLQDAPRELVANELELMYLIVGEVGRLVSRSVCATKSGAAAITLIVLVLEGPTLSVWAPVTNNTHM